MYLCKKRRKIGQIHPHQCDHQVCPQQSLHDPENYSHLTKSCRPQQYPSNFASQPVFIVKQKNEVTKLAESHLVSKLSGEKSYCPRYLEEDISTQRNHLQHLQVKRLENSEPLYQEIMDDIEKHGDGDTVQDNVNTKDNLINTKDKIIYGLITAKEVAKYRPCIQDIIVRDR